MKKLFALSGGMFAVLFSLLIFVCVICSDDEGSNGGSGNSTGSGGSDIVRVALSQVGDENNGGQKFWSYMGFTNKVPWCASFVSWCGNECGYIEAGVMPNSGLCNDFRDFFKERNQWKDSQAQGGNYIPKAGDFILFQWLGSATADLDHIGIVTACDGTTVFTVEGNSGDAVKCNTYPINSTSIIGYCTPSYPAGGYGGIGEGGYNVDGTTYTDEQMNIIYACVMQEDGGSYEGALAVISCVMNRVDSPAWSYCGNNAYEQLTSPSQFCYSIDTNWHRYLNGNVAAHVKQAVDDCLIRGIRNHNYTCFRSTQGNATGLNGEYIPDVGGNYYFAPL